MASNGDPANGDVDFLRHVHVCIAQADEYRDGGSLPVYLGLA